MNDVKMLVQETTEMLIDYIPKLINACDQVVEQEQAKQGSWVQLFQAMLDGIDWMISAVQSVKRVDVESPVAHVDIEPIHLLLGQIQDALQNQDFVLFGDLIQYELKPLLEGTHVQLAGGEQ